MRRGLTLALIAIALVAVQAAADEGMWLLDQLPELAPRLKAMGMELEPNEIWNPATGDGVARATVWLGGCSASFVSPDGLIITNHHCAFGVAQLNSTPERDIIEDGFLARDRADELPAPGMHAYVLDSTEDVTDRITSAIPAGADDAARQKAIERATKEVVAACEAEGDFRCRVGDMWEGLRYTLFRQLDLKDIRLVHIPARGIGEYGGDIDNWMWPRHTGDYSFLRAYVAPDGSSAERADENVPYHPKRWLQISSSGVAEGSFSFILGYPGSTMRHRSSYSVAHSRDFTFPERIALYRKVIDTLERTSSTSKQAEIANAATIKGLNNGLKYYQGVIDGISAFDLVAEKRTEEAALTAWIDADPARAERWSEVLPEIETIYAGLDATARHDMLLGWLYRASRLLDAAQDIVRAAEERAKPDLERDQPYMERNLPRVRQGLERMQRRLDLPSDRAVLRLILEEAAKLPEDQRIDALERLAFEDGRDAEAIDAFLDRLYAGTGLATVERRLELFDADAAVVAAADDPFLELARALEPERQEMKDRYDLVDGAFSRLRPQLIEAEMAFTDEAVYPDANSTIRMTYGTVEGYVPRDAVHMFWMTSLAGVVEKHTGEAPFDAPDALLAAAATGTPGPYRDTTIHAVPVNFLTTHDTTGGNSGSPVIDGSGRLIGLLFDGNYEAMSADWVFQPAITRSIVVDIRYVYWVLDRVYDARELIAETGDPFRVLATDSD